VLHIDDDPNDRALLKAASKKAGAQFTLHTVEDGEQAIAYLGGIGVYSHRRHYPLPTLVLLDLKMPRATGLEVLKWLRNQPELCHIPVVILSGSELQDDITNAYQLGANSYLVKPLGFDALVELVRRINSVWIASASLPPTVERSLHT